MLRMRNIFAHFYRTCILEYYLCLSKFSCVIFVAHLMRNDLLVLPKNVEIKKGFLDIR